MHTVLEFFGLNGHVEKVVDRVTTGNSKAVVEGEELALARSPPSTLNGDFFRLDDNLGGVHGNQPR
jgi:hypothetical protein